jgi:hypothetical protein
MCVNRFLFFAFVFVTACTGLIAPCGAIADETTYYEVIVEGGPEGLGRLRAFHLQLKKVLGVADLGEADIGCDACADLNTGPPETKLRFAMERGQGGLSLIAFVLSYHHVQTNANTMHKDFTLTVKGNPPQSPECPAIAQCMPRPICIQTGSCDKPFGGTCNKCL